MSYLKEKTDQLIFIKAGNDGKFYAKLYATQGKYEVKAEDVEMQINLREEIINIQRSKIRLIRKIIWFLICPPVVILISLILLPLGLASCFISSFEDSLKNFIDVLGELK